jgi:cob(I)alamin adenosyltransferase
MTEAPKAKIYTRHGDKGQTHLVDGSRVAKSDVRVEAYGTVDELNSALGCVRAELPSIAASLDLSLEKIQNQLFNVGSLLATEKKEVLAMLPPLTLDQVESLEKQIDQMTMEMPELREFILPAGSKAGSLLHLARTICRRAERNTSELVGTTDSYDLCLVYLNRLSDFLFVASRWVHHKMGVPDVVWKKNP